MVKAAEHIDLTSALTLAAFGVETKDDEFAVAMNVDHFGMERAEAWEKFCDALKRLQQAVFAEDLKLIGKFKIQLILAFSTNDTKIIIFA